MRHWVMAWVNPNVLLQNYCWKDMFFKSKDVAFSKWKKETNLCKMQRLQWECEQGSLGSDATTTPPTSWWASLSRLLFLKCLRTLMIQRNLLLDPRGTRQTFRMRMCCHICMEPASRLQFLCCGDKHDSWRHDTLIVLESLHECCHIVLHCTSWLVPYGPSRSPSDDTRGS